MPSRRTWTNLRNQEVGPWEPCEVQQGQVHDAEPGSGKALVSTQAGGVKGLRAALPKGLWWYWWVKSWAGAGNVPDSPESQVYAGCT